MDSHRNTDAAIETPSDDLSALAWVQDELRRSLDAATKALRRFVKEQESLAGSDVDVVDPSVLRTARQQIHQGVGALELVGLPAAATMLRACESAVQRFVQKPHKLTTAVVDDLERASFALLDYLSRILAGKAVSPLSLFPQYRAVQEAAGVDRIHPADLWAIDWQWRTLPAAGLSVTPRQPDASTRQMLEQQMLAMMRGSATVAAARMSDLFAGLGAGADSDRMVTLWRLAAAVFEAQAQGLVQSDVFSKRVAARLLSQLRLIERGDAEMSERLAQDLLFFCAQAKVPPSAARAPRLAAVRDAYGLSEPAIDYNVSPLGKFDPAWISQARKRVGAAKESWQGVAGGELHRMAGLSEQFALVGDSLRRLFPSGDSLAGELQQAVHSVAQAQAAPAAALAMEVATSLLYVEASLEDGEYDNAEQSARVRRLADRISDVRRGAAPAPLESWMEDLYRRVSDRQTMGSVVQELRASLSDVEKLIDQFFRKPDDGAVLMAVPNQLQSMRGVLSVLGMDHASQALLRMRDEVDHLASHPIDPTAQPDNPLFQRLAENLGALGFLIDMLSVQPAMAKSLFRFDAEAGVLSPVMGRAGAPRSAVADLSAQIEHRLIEQAQALAQTSVDDAVTLEQVTLDLRRLSDEATLADQPALKAAVSQAQQSLEAANDAAGILSVREQISEAMVDFVATANEPVGLEPGPAAAPMVLPELISLKPPADDLSEDDEMREIFLEEAREVLEGAHEACVALDVEPDDLSQLTTLRRAFHTLKGSSRMVGLKSFGDAAWTFEQLYNTRLGDQQPADAPLLTLTRWSLAYLGAWVDAIEAGRDDGHTPGAVAAAVAALGASTDAAAPSTGPTGAPTPTAPSRPVMPDIDLLVDLPHVAAETLPALFEERESLSEVTRRFTPEPLPVATEITFDLDLSAFEELAAAAATPTPPRAEPAPFDLLNLDLVAPQGEPATIMQPHTPEPVPRVDARVPMPEAAPAAAPEPATVDEEQVKVVGPLRIGIPLFNIFLTEADELSRRLGTELAEWSLELDRPVGEDAIAAAHSLAGSSATVGFTQLSQLSRTLEHALSRSHAIGAGTTDEAALFVDVADEVRRLLHQFAAGFLKSPPRELLDRLAAHELTSARRFDAATAAAELGGDAGPSTVAPIEPALDDIELIQLAAFEDSAAAADEVPAERVDGMAEAAGDDAGDDLDLPIDVTEPALPEPTVVEAVPEPETEAGPALEPAVAPAATLSLADFDTPESHFDALGQAELKPLVPLTIDLARAAPARRDDAVAEGDDEIDAVDSLDEELFPIFEEEALELFPVLDANLRKWVAQPADASHGAACMRALHTLKGGSRLAGAMRLGEMTHRMESRIEQLIEQDARTSEAVEGLQSMADGLMHTFEALRAKDAQAYADATATAIEALNREPEAPTDLSVKPFKLPVVAPVEADTAKQPAAAPTVAARPSRAPTAGTRVLPEIDWTRFAAGSSAAPRRAERASASHAAVRVRAPLLDRMVNQAGEVSITRSRIESEVGQIKGSLGDLTDNLERLRQQLRDIEFQAETQMTSRLEAAKQASQNFDPLEFDRFTRFQELTRMMAESVNDVATFQRTLQRTLETTEDELVAQARLTRDLQDDLLRTRMVEFESLSDRLYRVVRQASKETGKHVRLDIVGGSIEVDRGVLDRMGGAFEHLLRNCVSHGIESPEARTTAGKDATGTIVVALTQEGNEVGVEFRDDGAGLALERIRDKARAVGLIDADAQPADAELANLIFMPGFSTADTVTELAGRGVGMDVVRAEVNAMGGRIETATSAGQGTSFKLVLPLTTAVTQVVMVRIDNTTVAIPSTLIEIVKRATVDEVRAAYQHGAFAVGDRSIPFFWLGSLLHTSPRSGEPPVRTRQVLIVRSAQQRIALHVDEVLGNQEVVVKNLGPQLSRMPGLAGLTLMASGSVALIYNPVALATLYGVDARASTISALAAEAASGGAGPASQPVVRQQAAVVSQAPLVLVVDDSLTVRRVTQRLLTREGYRVVLAKDGLDALERLADEKPEVVLSDIEMPRMDGFDLVRNIRADVRLRDLPVIMITSRIAQKHRDYAAELGVDHYLGKPYAEDDLLSLVGRYTAHAASV